MAMTRRPSHDLAADFGADSGLVGGEFVA